MGNLHDGMQSLYIVACKRFINVTQSNDISVHRSIPFSAAGVFWIIMTGQSSSQSFGLPLHFP